MVIMMGLSFLFSPSIDRISMEIVSKLSSAKLYPLHCRKIYFISTASLDWTIPEVRTSTDIGFLGELIVSLWTATSVGSFSLS